MKNRVHKRFSRTGKMRARLEQIVQKVGERALPRLDGADLIGRQIVPDLVSLSDRTDSECRLLFEAQRHRALLYHESSGATPLDAADALVQARRILAEFPADAEQIGSLFQPARDVLDDLISMGSRHTSLECFDVLFATVVDARLEDSHRKPVVDAFEKMVEASIDDAVAPMFLERLIVLCDWARKDAPQELSRLVELVPYVLKLGLVGSCPDMILHAYLFARHLCVGFDDEVVSDIVLKLIENERVDSETRTIYQEYLRSVGNRDTLEDEFERLAYVNPDPDCPYDSDVDALNVMLSEFYAESNWVWRNRALLFRRRHDPVGAIACLARSMSLSGRPPELLGLLAPVLVEMGFCDCAREFARFAGTEIRERFHFDLIDDLSEETSSTEEELDLLRRIENGLESPGVPREFLPWLRFKRADLLLDLGELDEAAAGFKELLKIDPAEEFAAVKLAETFFRMGDMRLARRTLDGTFSARVTPFVEHLVSRIAEHDGLIADASLHNFAALRSIDDAQKSGRDRKLKFLIVIRDRIKRLHGPEALATPLLSLLETEVHMLRHHDVDRLRSVLEQRVVELESKTDDSVPSTEVMRDEARPKSRSTKPPSGRV